MRRERDDLPYVACEVLLYVEKMLVGQYQIRCEDVIIHHVLVDLVIVLE